MNTYNLTYSDGTTVLEAYIASKPTSQKSPKPAIFIFHAWVGRDSFACQQAEKLAELGYVGIALDMFGKGVLGRNREENQALIAPFIQDRRALLTRMQAGIRIVNQIPEADSKRLGAIGFCFGGLCALDLARSNADIRGVVSFHGLLFPPPAPHASTIRSKVLALHGHDDPMVPPEQVLAFEKEMTELKADWQLHSYGHTMHAFTVPTANDPSFGTVYNSSAERRSWKAMTQFFEEVMRE